MVIGQVGETSKAAEIGMAALAGVMMGSLSFGAMALVQGVRLIIDHFAQLKKEALEVSKVTVAMWQDSIKAGADSRQVIEDYASALEKITSNVDALKNKEEQESAVLKTVLEQRLKILDAERQAKIAKAGGDKEEETRINARYGLWKTEIELENEAAEIALKKKHLEVLITEGAKRQATANRAAAAKAVGAPGREEAAAAGERVTQLNTEMPQLMAARMKPSDLNELRQKVALYYDPNEVAQSEIPTYGQTLKGQLDEAEAAEEAYAAAQQEYEQAQADIERYKAGTKKLADTTDQAIAALDKIVAEVRAAEADLQKAQAIHSVNADASATIQSAHDRTEIEMAGGKYNRATQTVLDKVRAMSGTAEGHTMSGQDVTYFNNLLAAARDPHQEDMAKAVIAELRNLHVDEGKKWRDLWNAIQQIRQETHQAHQAIGNLTKGLP